MFCAGFVSAARAADDLFAVAADHYRRQEWQQAADAFARLLADDAAHARTSDARFFYGETLAQLGDWRAARDQFQQLLQANPAGAHARQALFRAAEAAYMTGDDGAALAELRKFNEQYPDDPLGAYVLPYLGSLELQAGDAQTAQTFFARAVEQFADGPLAAESQFGWAQALQNSQQLDEARERYRKVVEGSHALAEQALVQSAALDNSLGNFSEALASLDQMAERFPQSKLAERASLARGYALHKLDRHGEAAKVLQAIAADPTLGTEATYWYGLAEKAQQHWPAAAEALASLRVSADDPLAPAIAFHAADALEHAGDAAAARAAFDRVLEQFPTSAWADDALVGKLHLAAEAGDHDQTVRLADELLERFAESPLARQAQLAKGQALGALDKPAEALKALQPLLESAAEGDAVADLGNSELLAQARAVAALSRAKLGQFDEARQTLEALATDKAAPLANETAYQLAEMALASGKGDLAGDLFGSVTGGDAASEVANRAQSGLAWSHFQAQRWQEAADAFGRLLETDPDGPQAAEAALLRGRALAHLGQFDEADAMYRTVIDRHPSSPRAAEALWHDAQLHEQLGRPEEARRRYATLVEGHADFAERDAAMYRYARLLAPEDADAADAMLVKLRWEFPDTRFAPDAALHLAERAVDQQRFDDAAPLLAEITDLQAPPAVRRPALYLSGRLEMSRNQWAAAVVPLEKLLAEFPTDELVDPATYLIAEADFRQGHYQQAADRLSELADRTPDRADDWLAMAELRRAQSLAHLRDWRPALNVARGIAMRFPDFREQYEVDYLIGRALAAQADFAAAREAYTQVLEAPAAAGSETATMARWMLGESYFHQENYAAALAEYLQIDDRFPRWHAAALLQAGKCGEAIGRWPEAAQHYASLLEKYPTCELSAEATRRLDAARGRAAGRQPVLQ